MYRYADEKQKSAIGTIVVLLLFVFLLNGYGWAGRVDTPINDQWRFYRADAANAQLPSFDDSA
jgi:hypothetical protein